MAVGGDLIEITYNHPTIGSGTFYPKSEEAGTYDPGGFISSDDSAGITSSGEMIDKMTNTRWSVGQVVRSDMNVAEDLERMKELQRSPVLADWTFTHVNQTVYGGKGKPVGTVEADTMEATLEMKIQGGGRLKKIIG